MNTKPTNSDPSSQNSQQAKFQADFLEILNPGKQPLWPASIKNKFDLLKTINSQTGSKAMQESNWLYTLNIAFRSKVIYDKKAVLILIVKEIRDLQTALQKELMENAEKGLEIDEQKALQKTYHNALNYDVHKALKNYLNVIGFKYPACSTEELNLSLDIIEVLITAGADPLTCDDGGLNTLQQAILNHSQNSDLIVKLIELTNNLETPTPNFNSKTYFPFGELTREGRKANNDYRRSQHLPPLNPESWRKLSDLPAFELYLNICKTLPDFKVVEKFIEKTGKPNTLNKNGQSYLHLLMNDSSTTEKEIKHALSLGMSPNIKDIFGKDPMQAKNGIDSNLALLLKAKGFLLAALVVKKLTALHHPYAIQSIITTMGYPIMREGKRIEQEGDNLKEKAAISQSKFFDRKASETTTLENKDSAHQYNG